MTEKKEVHQLLDEAVLPIERAKQCAELLTTAFADLESQGGDEQTRKARANLSYLIDRMAEHVDEIERAWVEALDASGAVKEAAE